MKRYTRYEYPTSQTVIVAGLCLLWWNPSILSDVGIGIVIAWVYGYLLARVITTGAQYGLLHWGVSRWGIVTLSATLAFLGLAIMYFAWTREMYAYMGIGWIMLYTGYYTGTSAYRRNTGTIHYEIYTTLEYAVVSLMAMALFGGYISSSPIGQLGLVYAGLAGESLLFLSIAMLACETAHHAARYMYYRTQKNN